MAEEDTRLEVRAKKPLEVFMMMATSKDFNADIEERNRMVTEIVNSPYVKYIELRNRLRVGGATTSFPEFKGVVAKLTQAIYQDKTNTALIAGDPTLKNIVDLLTHSLMAIQIGNRYIWPYKSTILVIEDMLNVLDILARKKNPNLPGYYHNLRYRLYLTYLLDDAFPDNIIFPTIFPIGSTFLIKTRCVPFLFLGVVTDVTHADQYDNTPIDFWAHDVQHGRRLLQEDQHYYDIIVKHQYYYTKRSPFDFVSKEEYHQEQYAFTKVLLELIKITPADTPQQKAYKNIKKLIIFEVIHEKAWPVTKFSMCRNIPLGYDVFPIETMVESQQYGLKAVDSKFQDPTTLANVYHKLRKGFYDKVSAPDPKIVDPVYRTAEDIARAAKELLEQIKCTVTYEFEKLLALTQDPKGAEEFTEKPDEIAFPDKKDISVLERFPTESIRPWQVEEEAPVITEIPPPTKGGRHRTYRKKRTGHKKFSV
jgi:hypothetical protein